MAPSWNEVGRSPQRVMETERTKEKGQLQKFSWILWFPWQLSADISVFNLGTLKCHNGIFKTTGHVCTVSSWKSQFFSDPQVVSYIIYHLNFISKISLYLSTLSLACFIILLLFRKRSIPHVLLNVQLYSIKFISCKLRHYTRLNSTKFTEFQEAILPVLSCRMRPVRSTSWIKPF